MWGVSTRFQAVAGGSRALPGAFKGVGRKNTVKNALAAYRQSLEPWARLKFHAGWSGWTRPPTMAGGAGRVRRLQGGVEGFLKASECPEAGYSTLETW